MLRRAIRIVRARAKEFSVSPDKIGVIGFSAGGHLASTTETHFDSGNPQAADPIDRESSRPDFAVLAYPVISFTAEYTHQGSRNNLLDENPKPELVKELSSELNVTPQTPPTFLFTSSTDTVVPPENSVAFYLALHKAGVPAELHIFEKAPHGVGLDLADPSVGEWSTLLLCTGLEKESYSRIDAWAQSALKGSAILLADFAFYQQLHFLFCDHYLFPSFPVPSFPQWPTHER